MADDCAIFDMVGAPHFCEKNFGEDAVAKAIEMVKEISIEAGLDDISVFLYRIARAESNLGRHASTFREGYFGGIWQIDKIGFEETQKNGSHPSLNRIHTAVERKFKFPEGTPLGHLPGVKWKEASWKDCLIPAYSCVAARLLLAIKQGKIPDSLEGQAKYWKEHYNTSAGSGTVEHFIRANS